jgi:FK506-binding nuclear protein
MKYLAPLVLALIVCVAGCGKKETAQTTPSTTEEKTTQTSGASKETTATPEPAAGKEAAKPSAPAAKSGPGGWVKLQNGLQYRDLKVGTGPEAKTGDTLTVDYKGWLDNGKVFDTSKKPGGQPFVFQVGQGSVIPGWDQGLPGMKAGGKRELKIPPALGYGDMEMGSIPANSTLHFEVDLVKVNNKS